MEKKRKILVIEQDRKQILYSLQYFCNWNFTYVFRKTLCARAVLEEYDAVVVSISTEQYRRCRASMRLVLRLKSLDMRPFHVFTYPIKRNGQSDVPSGVPSWSTVEKLLERFFLETDRA